MWTPDYETVLQAIIVTALFAAPVVAIMNALGG